MVSKNQYVRDLRPVLEYLIATHDYKGASRSGWKLIQGNLADIMLMLKRCSNKAGFHIKSGDLLRDSADLVYPESSFMRRYNIVHACNPIPLDLSYATILHRNERNCIDMHTIVHEEFLSTGRNVPLYYPSTDKSYLWESSIYISEKEGLTVPLMQTPQYMDRTYGNECSPQQIVQRDRIHNCVLTDFHHGQIENREDVLESLGTRGYETLKSGKRHLLVKGEDCVVKMAGQFYQEDFSAEKLIRESNEKREFIQLSKNQRAQKVSQGIKRRAESFVKLSNRYVFCDLALEANKSRVNPVPELPNKIRLNKMYFIPPPRLSDAVMESEIETHKEEIHEIGILSRVRAATERIGEAIKGLERFTEFVGAHITAEQEADRKRTVSAAREDIRHTTPYERMRSFAFNGPGEINLPDPTKLDEPEAPNQSPDSGWDMEI